jgi:Tol biopolymer transport system component
MYPCWSPDGKRIFFRWKGGGLASVPNEGGEVRVHEGVAEARNKNGFFISYPSGGISVSPDGKFVAFSGGWAKSGPFLYTAPVDGGEPKPIAGGGMYPCWSPDGKWLAYLAPEIISEEKTIRTIFKVPAAGGEAQKITTESDNVTAGGIDWSPDGKKIAFYRKGEDRVEVWLVENFLPKAAPAR